ncbi:MAG: ATP-binding protein [Kofleriaceae bacterium]
MRLRAFMSSIERRGRWELPALLEIRAMWGNVVLDLREVELPATATIDVKIMMANVELIVPPHVDIELQVTSSGSNVEEIGFANQRADRPKITLTGGVKLANLEIVRLERGQSRPDLTHRERIERKRARHRRWRELHAEREMWHRHRHDHQRPWMPWWLMARMRRRMFIWLALAVGGGIGIGMRLDGEAPRWWWIAIGLFVLFAVSGAIAFRLTRPLLMVVRAARDIGDGKLDTRLDIDRHGGETRLLAVAINDMAEKIKAQLADQRQLLAAVSHELRTPLGHMRVLVETARETGNPKSLAELDREILVLDDLVGKLLASSRLEFGNLDRRPLDLGELVTDVATSAGIAPEAIEAIGDVGAAIDPTLVRRAVANLIDNARVHGNGAIAVRIERRAGQVAIEVDDAGPGVPADRRADAFRAFVPSSGGGLGLGLALVSRIAVAHGGGAWIADRPGGGARVGFAVEVAPVATT